jgi:hypothetical protein
MNYYFEIKHIENDMTEIYSKLFNIYESLPNDEEILQLVKQYKKLNVQKYLIESCVGY